MHLLPPHSRTLCVVLRDARARALVAPRACILLVDAMGAMGWDLGFVSRVLGGMGAKLVHVHGSCENCALAALRLHQRIRHAAGTIGNRR
eukprot:6943667-Prymnesium_polylepis.1